ncbi:MAG: septum formation initiator family protein [Clostridia bacterium]|nr:septum formation initiator family protein [Clostridia bacterium]
MRRRAITEKLGKAKRTRKKMNPVIRGLLIVGLVYLAGNMLLTTIKIQGQIKEKKTELDAVNQEISSQSVKNEELNDIFNGKVDKEYWEKIAREQGYVMDGEQVFENITDQ